MANAVLATFSADDVARFGEGRFKMLMAAITPSLNVWAGEIIWWERTDAGEYLVMGQPR